MACNSNFYCDANFCPVCGAILPSLGSTGALMCIICKHEIDIHVMENYEVKYTVNLNTKSNYQEESMLKKTRNDAEGPVVERTCSKCGNDTMSYASLQLRSADEGQTIFYTCTSCNHKETENS